MKKFILHIALFLTGTLFISYISNISNQAIVDSTLKRYHKETKTLILGDSHARWINETVIPNSYNLFQGGDTYKASYYKLSKMVELAPKIDTVIIGFDLHNLGQLYSKKILKRKESIKRISQIASISDMYKTTDNKSAFIELLFQQKLSFNFKSAFKTKKRFTFDDNTKYHKVSDCKFAHNTKKNIAKNYSSQKENNPEKINKKIESTKWFYFRDGDFEMGDFTIEYLDKMLQICNERNIVCYLVSFPIEPELSKIIPEKYSHKFNEVLSNLGVKYNFNYINLRHEYDNQIGLLENPDHMSEYGGALVSEKLLSIFDSQNDLIAY